MSDVKKLLAEASPLPWRIDEFDLYLVGPDDENIHWDTEGLGATWRADADPRLIVHAVNSLPAYEAVAEALERVVQATNEWHESGSRAGLRLDHALVAARDALAQLRGAK